MRIDGLEPEPLATSEPLVAIVLLCLGYWGAKTVKLKQRKVEEASLVRWHFETNEGTLLCFVQGPGLLRMTIFFRHGPFASDPEGGSRCQGRWRNPLAQ